MEAGYVYCGIWPVLEQGAQVGPDVGLEEGQRVGPDADAVEGLNHHIDATHEDGLEDFVLRGEVVVDRTGLYPDGCGKLAQGCLCVAGGQEQVGCLVEDPNLGWAGEGWWGVLACWREGLDRGK